jgi:hypothetical protein
MNFSYSFLNLIPIRFFHSKIGGSRGRIHMIIGFITTYAISAYHHHHCEFESRSGKVYSMQHYVINLSVTCHMSVVFSGYSSFLHQ